jgi:GT2 family glycosyltransferase
LELQADKPVSELPEISIVVVTWNSRDDVLRCLASLEGHVRLPYEAIVVDDGSDDGTPEAVREQFPDARLLAKPVNEGLVAGRNDALPLIRGRLVLMLDADTEVRPGAVEALAAVLDTHPEVGLVGPKLVGPDRELQLSCRRYPPLLIPFMRRGPYARLNPDPPAHRRHLMKDYDHNVERPVVWVSGAAQMWRADLRQRMGSYDRLVSSYGGEDLDWCLRVWGSGLEVRYAPAAEILHVWQQMTRRKLYGSKSFRALRDWYYLQWKHRALRRDPRLVEANR